MTRPRLLGGLVFAALAYVPRGVIQARAFYQKLLAEAAAGGV